MGCNCGGSTPRSQQPQELQRSRAAVRQPPLPRRAGGPGTPEYYWTGQAGYAKPAESDEPAAAADASE